MIELKYHNIDCMEGMKHFPDKYFELAIVDPPYNVGASDGNFGRNVGTYRKDLKHYANKNTTPDKKYFDELFRVSVNQIIWGANYYPQYLHHSGALIWIKKKCNKVLSDAEIAFQSFSKMVKIYDLMWYGYNKVNGSFESDNMSVIHPNQKPLILYEKILEDYAKQGDKILDTHVGSGSSIIAFEKHGFDYCGFEIDKDYYDSSMKRILKHRELLQQEVLF